MIGLNLINHGFFNESADIIRMYLGKCEIEGFEGALADSQSFLKVYDTVIISRMEISGTSYTCTSYWLDRDKHVEATAAGIIEPSDLKTVKRLVKKSMYRLLSQVFQREYPWGILTGIRPVKIVHELMWTGLGKNEIMAKLAEEYMISEDRAKLAVEIAEIERPFIYPADTSAVSIYIGIPFCPSRCHYCSFTSNSIDKLKAYVEPYLESLMHEISVVSEYLLRSGFRVQTVYIGGGTPTALNEEQLDRLLKCVNSCFGEQAEEFTCEAGRPDSITKEKLRVLAENKVSRISINPQTMNDATLKCIGRAHSAGQVVECFSLAREEGFGNINMDLILGLPGEGMEQLVHTLEEIRKLSPESVTVHTMALKRASLYNEGGRQILSADDESTARMMEYTKEFLRDMGMHPYYLYRQKHMLQNLENIGFSQKGYECIYNMQIIEEKQTIVAFGADAVTKIYIDKQNRLERQHNIKDVKIYIENLEAMIRSKLDILEQLRKSY
jgi:coproporphyrinogen dehydrogenase HemZ